jgi:hypothetical protein
MSIARHHAEWLSLVPVSGPFLSLPVLMEAFPQGLDAHDAEHARLLRLAYEEWDDSFQKKNTDPSIHDAWINFVLTKTLEFDESLLADGQAIPQTLHVEVPEHGELLKPNIVLNDPATKKARMLIQKYPRTQNLTSYVAGSRWKASPDSRMTDLLHGTGVRLGLVTNGEHWMLVDAPKGETTGYASWYASLWREEKITLQAFRTPLSMPRFFGVSDDETIEALLTKSASNQQDVTDQLGAQVLRAVEVLIQSLDKADQDHGRELLEGVSEAVLYESALNVMMRLVFLFCAEERELIPTKPFPVYEQNYSVSTISKQLREIADQHGEELLERRYDAWPRLLSAFRAVYGGLAHDDVYMPAYGGRLFDPDRFPFLEGRKPKTTWQDTEATPLPVNNRTVLHLLEALQLLQVKVPGGGPAEARRLSFRALDIEQIGHVYEGLLDHTAKRATEPTVGLTGKKEPEVAIQKLEKEREKGDKSFYEFLKKECGSSRKWENYLDQELDDRQQRRLRTACGNDESLFERVKPFAGLIREDSFGYPVVVPKKSVFVTAGTDRRSSGTHYTPRSLTEPIVQYTLEPLVYVGPAEGTPKSEWKLKSAAELLDLKICDMACGSGAFLVQAARYMSERLMEAWDAAKEAHPDVPGITPEGTPSTGEANESLIPDDPAERTVYAMRIVAQRCLFGVDVNPLATEMAKLSLWLLTLAKDKPFEFLDHAIRCGDSLVGLHDIDQLKFFSLKPDQDGEAKFFGPWLDGVDEAIDLRLKLEDMPSNTVEDVEAQEELLKEAEDKIARLRCAADILVAAEFWGEGTKDKQEKVRHAAVFAGHYVEKGPTDEFEEKAATERRGQKMFHWPLEFPEVVVKRGGFDAFVGNPPFLGSKYWASSVSPRLTDFSITILNAKPGHSDICALFHRRALPLLSDNGIYGLIGAESLREGDSLKVGLQPVAESSTIYRAYSSLRWPGTATVRVCVVWTTCNGSFVGTRILDDVLAEQIDGRLSDLALNASPHILATGFTAGGGCHNAKGEMLILEQDNPWKLRLEEAKSPFLRQYVTNDDMADHGFLQCERFVVYTSDLGFEEVENRCSLTAEFLNEVVRPIRTPEYLKSFPGLSQRWWQFHRSAADLYRKVTEYEKYIVIGMVTKYVVPARLPCDWISTNKLCVFADDCAGVFGLLLSSFTDSWLRTMSGSLGETLSVSIKKGVHTFPFPPRTPSTLRRIEDDVESSHGLLLRQFGDGYTGLYNRLHDAEETSDEIQNLRNLHVEMDQAIATAYGWDDLNLGHGFHETKQGLRFTISDPARREVLQRLLKLNHERYEEEVAQGLHKKKKGRKKAASKKKTAKKTQSKQGATLFDMEGDE